jgi:Transposase DDE domain
MLLLAGRGFYSWQLWTAAQAAGAHLLWRVTPGSGGLHLPVVRELPDGSYLSRITDPVAAGNRSRKNGKRRRAGKPPDTSPLPAITVRVIEFILTVTADDGGTRTERYRMITTLLDHRAFPAAGLAAGYARRWAIETAYREFKTYLRGPGRRLRGRTPDLARQELWAYLAIYQALRVLITRAAARDGTDPARISFTAALNAAQRTLGTDPGALGDALQAAETEMLSCLLPVRHGRICPRAVKQVRSAYKSRSSHPGPITQHARYTATIATPDSRTQTTANQAKHHAQRPDDPP